MKNLNSCLLLFLFPFFGWAQSLNGVYTGVLSNDSTTIRKDQSFEMALTEYKGKVYGYAYSTFIINDTLYYIVKRVKGTVNGDLCEVKDDEVISHNFPRKPEKKVFVTYTLRRNKVDSAWNLDGNWKTNTTKKYYALTGKVDTKEEKDLSKSKLYEHLGDLNLQQTLAFNKAPSDKPDNKDIKSKPAGTDVAKTNVKADKEKEIAAVESNQGVKKTESGLNNNTTKVPDTKSISVTTNSQSIATEKKDAAAVDSKLADNKIHQTLAKNDTKIKDAGTNSIPDNNQSKQTEVKNGNVAVDTKPFDNKNQQSVAINDVKTKDAGTNSIPDNNQSKQTEVKNGNVAADTKPIDNKNQQAVAISDTKTPDAKNKIIAANNLPKSNEIKGANVSEQNQSEKKAEQEYEFTELNRSNRILKPATNLVKSRESTPSETIAFKSDSLVLALYDNGEVDGDTVSVIINNEVFIEKQGLKSAAFKKTFYYSPDLGDSLLVVLFAENLGKYPPNTGLLIIKDGEEQHYVRFKADFDSNAAIMLRKEY